VAVERNSRGAPLIALLAAGPLIKLTALPVAAFAVVSLLRDRRTLTAIASAAAAAAVGPVQSLRGWRWGGTVELNRPGRPIAEPASGILVGLVRSAYAFVKTTMWVGGWSQLRPPKTLALLYIALLAATLLLWRPRPSERRAAYLSALAVAIGGFLVFAVANRRLYGDWGGLAGWYLWDWSPWIIAGGCDLGSLRAPWSHWLLSSMSALVIAANVFWLVAHARLYGW